MRLQSGPGRVDIIRFGLIAAAMLFWAGLAFKDWKYGYVAENRQKAREMLTPKLGQSNVPSELGARPTKADFDALAASNPQTLEDVTARLDQADFPKDNPRGDGEKVFYSDFGMATVRVQSGRIEPKSLGWQTWSHTESETHNQLYWGLGALAIGLFLLWKAIKAATMRVTIDDQGMKYGGEVVPFEAMIKLSDYRKKGLCTLHHRGPTGDENRLRMDSWAVAKFDAIIDELCRAKDWPDPRKEADEAEEPATAP